MSPASFTGKQKLTLAAMCLGLFMVMLDETIVSVALPTIQRSLSMSTTELQWVNNAYTLVIGVSVVAAGRLGDIFGRRRLFLFGTVVFTLGSLLCGVAQNAPMLIGSRAFEGIGSGIMLPLTLSILGNTFSSQSRGRAIGIWAGVSGLALSAGPIVGGLLTEYVAWQSIFLVNVPIGIVTFMITTKGVDESCDSSASRSIDFFGLSASCAGLSLVVVAIMEGQGWGWESPRTLAVLATGLVLLVLFVIHETRAGRSTDRQPLVRMGMFSTSTFSGAVSVAFLVSFGLIGLLFFMPLYLQNVLDFTPVMSGLSILPLTTLITVVAPISGRLADKFGPRWPLAGGQVLMLVGFILLTRVSPNSSYSYLWLPFMLLGTGIGAAMSPMSTACMNAVSETEAGSASGILNMSRQIGGTFGVATLGVVFIDFSTSKFKELVSRYPTSIQVAAKAKFARATSDPASIAAQIHALPAHEASQVSYGLREIFVAGFIHIFVAAALVAVLGLIVTVGAIGKVTTQARK